jgi:HPt (histidine-containing phosphotransfer) domain-containing protein
MCLREHQQPPLVCRSILDALWTELEDTVVYDDYVADYLQIWESRYDRLATAVRDADISAALDAVLSVKSSASMVGAARLATLAAEVEQSIRSERLAGVIPLLSTLATCGRSTLEELRAIPPGRHVGLRAGG